MTLHASLARIIDLCDQMPPGHYRLADYTMAPTGAPGVTADAWETFVIPPGTTAEGVARYVAALSPAVVRALVAVAKAAHDELYKGGGLYQVLDTHDQLYLALAALEAAMKGEG